MVLGLAVGGRGWCYGGVGSVAGLVYGGVPSVNIFDDTVWPNSRLGLQVAVLFH